MVPSQIPALWWWGGAAVWTVIAFFFAIRGGWTLMPDRAEGFPFSARQFFLMLTSSVVVFAAYIASFILAHLLVDSIQKISINCSVDSLRQAEWLAIEQIIGLIVGTIAISVVIRLLPADIVLLVTGRSQGWKKLVKGAVLGVVFVPIILLATWVIGFVITIVSPETRAPQIALEVLANLRPMSVLFWLLITAIVTIVPYVEEMLFRGFLQGFFNGIVHPTLSIVLTSAAFALFHYSPLQKSSNFEIMTGLFVFSILASQMRAKEDSLHASIGMHAAFNATSLCLFFGLS